MLRKNWRIGAAGLCAALIVTLSASPGSAATLLGEAQKMGKGTLRTYVDLDSGGAPSAIGVLLSKGALAGLPPKKNATSRCFDLNKNGKIDGPAE